MERNPLKHPLLFGEYELTIDDKNRLLVPSEIRKAINSERDGDAFFMVVGVNRLPWLYTERYYEVLANAAPAELAPGDDLLEFDQMRFALTSRLEPDKQGRMLIPEKTLKRTGLEKEITMIGVKDHLELWNRADWEARRDVLMARSSEVTLRAKQAMQPPRNV